MDIRKIRSFDELRMQFGQWAGSKWVPTQRQLSALKNEAKEVGIPVSSEERRIRAVERRGLPRGRILTLVGVSRAKARFSKSYSTYSTWREKRHASSYERRVSNYMKRHPDASLREARRHKSKRRR